jgi:hypothetical protein
MSRLGVVIGLLALACGGNEPGALFDPVTGEPQGGGAQLVAGSSGEAGEPAGVAGSESAAAGQETGGTGQGGATQGGAGSAGKPTTGGESAIGGMAQGGSVATGGGAGMSGSAGGGQAGSVSGGGTGGARPEPVCKIEGWMDCNGVLGDGTAHLMPDDCEMPRTDHDNCGTCGHKCGLSQICKMLGSPGAWNYGCGSP